MKKEKKIAEGRRSFLKKAGAGIAAGNEKRRLRGHAAPCRSVSLGSE
jgi:hypothetical protein